MDMKRLRRGGESPEKEEDTNKIIIKSRQKNPAEKKEITEIYLKLKKEDHSWEDLFAFNENEK